MNKKQAEKNGYDPTGAYSHDKEEMKESAKEERAKGNKAIVVNIPPSKYSRGHHGMGCSVYIIESAENIKAKKIAFRNENIKRINYEIIKKRNEIMELEIKLVNELDELNSI